MEFLMAILSVLAIIALIVVAGFIIYALADLVIAIIEKKNGNVFSKDKTKSDSYKYNASLELKDEDKFLLDEDVNMIDYEEPKNQKTTNEDDFVSGVDDVEAERERLLVKKSSNSDVDWFKEDNGGDYQSIIREERKKMLENKEKKQQELIKNHIVEEEIISDNDNEEEIENNEDEQFKAINREAYHRVQLEKAAEKEFEDDEFDDLFLNDEEDEEVEETIQQVEMPTEEVIEESKVDEYQEKLAELEQKLLLQQEENEKIRKQMEENEQKIKEANDREQEAKRQKEELENKMHSATPLEYDEDLLNDYIAKLEILQERQRVNDKELKQNKKEFQPLNRIKTTLTKDQAKLRRKEAIVAKQKIMLFGVNNSDGVDEEKAKKLDEEIDLLEGLRLSVQHCENVMQENKDRFPVLEKANKILLNNKEQIASDIKEIEDKIEVLKNLKK